MAPGTNKLLPHNNLQEGLVELRPGLSFSDSEEKFCGVADKWLMEAKPLHDQMLAKQDKAERYYLGFQLEENKLRDYEARVVLNKVFQNLETIIPIVTNRTPAPMSSLPEQVDGGKQVDFRTYCEQLEEIVMAIAQDCEIGQVLKEFVRFHELFLLGVIKFGYDEECGEIWIENIRPQRVLIPSHKCSNYVIEFHDDTLEDLIAKFPEKERAIRSLIEKEKKEGQDGTIVGYYEITTPEIKFWKLKDILLKKVRNPHFKFADKDLKGKKKKQFEKKNNHWAAPQLDYLFSDMWTMGTNHYSKTTLVHQVLSLQDSLNKRKRQISDNADQAQGLLVGYGQLGVTKQEVAELREARRMPNGAVVLEKAVQGSVQHFGGQQLEPYVFQDMTHTISEIDNIFGTHSTLRGERTAGEETFGGRQMLKGADEGRLGELVAMLERICEKLYNAIAQMIKVHFEDEQFVAYLGKDGAEKQVKIGKDIIREGVKIVVRQGSTLIKDKAAMASEAIQLWQTNAIDPISLFELIGIPNPYKMAERLYQWMLEPKALFKNVALEYDSATKSSNENKILASVLEAGIENNAMLKGAPTPPAENVTSQHLAVHQELIEDPQFIQTTDPAIKQIFSDHVSAELEIFKEQVTKQRTESRQTQDERVLNSFTQFNNASAKQSRFRLGSQGPQLGAAQPPSIPLPQESGTEPNLPI